eukprot:2073736-Rhodomonas_salina.2
MSGSSLKPPSLNSSEAAAHEPSSPPFPPPPSAAPAWSPASVASHVRLIEARRREGGGCAM